MSWEKYHAQQQREHHQRDKEQDAIPYAAHGFLLAQ
jgi:hypothetical protein